MYISLDPGASPKGTGLTGYATFTAEGVLMDMESLSEDEIKPRFLQDIKDNNIQAVIYETWRLDPKTMRVFTWSDMPTPKLIGWIEGVCDLAGIERVPSGPQMKANGYKHWGRSPLPKSNPMNHAYDAVVHGREYLIKIGVLSV